MLPVSLDCAVFVSLRLVYPMLPFSLDCALFIQRKWQHRVEKTEINKAKIQHNPEKLTT
jgi:hypothetical protein